MKQTFLLVIVHVFFSEVLISFLNRIYLNVGYNLKIFRYILLWTILISDGWPPYNHIDPIQNGIYDFHKAIHQENFVDPNNPKRREYVDESKEELEKAVWYIITFVPLIHPWINLEKHLMPIYLLHLYCTQAKWHTFSSS